MADEATATVPAEVTAPTTTTTTDDVTEPAPAAEPTNAEGEAPITKEDEQTAGAQATTEVNAPEGRGTAEAAAGPASAVGEATPVSKQTPSKRAGGTSGQKNAKGKRKSMPTLHLDCEPGEYYWARLKGHPPWPAIVCDEQMLPESLLATRPVSTARPDGTLRDDFKAGGKNAKERTFPIMFLSTNEFAWMINTALTPLEPSECENPTAKMSKALQNAYKIASEAHDLAYFKDILKAWQEEQAHIEKLNRELEEKMAMEEEERQRKKAEAADDEAKGKKKKSRKSKGGDEDVDMADADAPKSSKKRKKEAESDADGAKPKKTPKVTKINAPKTPNGESATKKSAKPKKKVEKVVTAPEETKESKPQMTEEERLSQREKAVLYLRHRLQKGFLSRDQAPQESEMAAMSDFFKQLETYENLEPSIIRTTKIHKVLKAIVKLISIPKEEEYNFKRRSSALLEIWNKRMEGADGVAATPAAAKDSKSAEPEAEPSEEKAPETNGEATQVNGDAKAEETEKPVLEDKPETATDLPAETKEPEAPAEVSAEAPAEVKTDAVADVPAAPVEEKAEPVNDASAEATAVEKPVVPAEAMDTSA